MTTYDESEETFDAQFIEIKQRFVCNLPDRLVAISSALNEIQSGGATTEAVTRFYDAVHSMCGIAPMLGFAKIGQTARSVDGALVAAFRAKRGLAADEIVSLRPLAEALLTACLATSQSEGCEVLR